jgi:hypothetical protein
MSELQDVYRLVDETCYEHRTMTILDDIHLKLSTALQAQDADAFELALDEAFQRGLHSGLAGTLAAALGMEWHTRHEELASALQKLRDPNTVEALYAAANARHPYLDEDEFFGLARKCTWALADIGTPPARARLEDLSRSDNELIAAYACKRLLNWERERERKASSLTWYP